MFPMSDVRAYVQLTRPQNASGSLVTYGIGYFLASSSLSPEFFVGLIILLAIHALATVQNDIQDFEIDRANKRPSGLQDHSISLRQAQLFVQALMITALSVAIFSSQRRLNLSIIAMSSLVAWLYNRGPVRASKRPVSSIVLMGLCYGTLPFAYGYLIAGGPLHGGYVLPLACLLFLARVSTTIMKDYKDAAGDKLLAKNTFYLRYGGKVTAQTSLLSGVLAYAGLVVILIKLGNHRIIFTLALAAAGLLALRSIMLRLMLTKTSNEKRLNVIFHKCILSHNQFEMAALLCLLLS